MGLGTSGKVLFFALLLVSGGPLIQSTGRRFGGGLTAARESPHSEPLAISSTPTSFLQGVNLSGIWQDTSGNTYTVIEGPYDIGGEVLVGYYYFLAKYLTDPACPAALNGGTSYYIVAAFNAGGDSQPPGTVVGQTILASAKINTRTRATNPIVEN